MPTSPIPPDVRRWLDQQDAAERPSLEEAWTLTGLAEPEPAPLSTDDAWAALVAEMDAPEPRPAPPRAADRAPARPQRRTALRLVGSALAVAGAVLVAVWLRPVTVEAGAEVAEVALPDGSEVTLAPGSEIAYRRGLRGGTRRVEIEGQGLFEVARDGRPFVVETANATVEVLGTTFDVQAWPGVGDRSVETAVALVEGSVRLASPAGDVVLEPGETSRVVGAGRPTPPLRVDVEAVTAWRAGGFSVVDAPLASVAAAVQARFGRPVQLAPGVDADRRLTLFLPSAETADSVLVDVAAYLDLRLQADPSGYVLAPQ